MRLLHACKLAAWGASDEGEDEDVTALYWLLDSLQARLEDRHHEADAICKAARGQAADAQTPVMGRA